MVESRMAPHAAWCAGVPPLPPVASWLGPAYANFVWMYDQNFQIRSYSFSDLDVVGAQTPDTRAHVLGPG